MREVAAEARAEHGAQLTAEKLRAAVNGLPDVSEQAFQQAVTDAMTALGWRWIHFRPAQTARGWRTPLSGSPGFPDIVAVKGERVLFIELKSMNGKLRDEQRYWLSALGAAGAEVHCWKPEDWPLIEGLLR